MVKSHVNTFIVNIVVRYCASLVNNSRISDAFKFMDVYDQAVFQNRHHLPISKSIKTSNSLVGSEPATSLSEDHHWLLRWIMDLRLQVWIAPGSADAQFFRVTNGSTRKLSKFDRTTALAFTTLNSIPPINTSTLLSMPIRILSSIDSKTSIRKLSSSLCSLGVFERSTTYSLVERYFRQGAQWTSGVYILHVYTVPILKNE